MGKKRQRDTSLLTSLRLGRTLLSEWQLSQLSEAGTIPKQIQQKVPLFAAGLSAEPSWQEPSLASRSPRVEGRGAAQRDDSVGKGL